LNAQLLNLFKYDPDAPDSDAPEVRTIKEARCGSDRVRRQPMASEVMQIHHELVNISA
jgi:hypothetical protein